MSELMSQADVAAYLGLSLRSMRMLGPDVLPKYKIGPRGGRVMYKRSDVEAYVEASRQPIPAKVVRRMIGRIDGKPARHV